MPDLTAGAAQTTITPPSQGTLLLGALQRSTGVHDDLYARAVVLARGAQRVAIVTLDLVGLDAALVERLRTAVRQQTGLPASHVLLNCSHTHSAPFTIPWSVLGCETFEQEAAPWRDELVDRVADTVRAAASRLEPATLRFAREPVQIGSNRRLPTDDGVRMKPNPDGPVVPWTDVLRVDGAGRRAIAVLFSHAAHPVIVHGASTLISADYPGYAVRAVRERLGGDVVALFAQGCGANINADPLRGGFEAAQHAGTILGTAATKAALRAQAIEVDRLHVRTTEVALPFQPAPPEDEVQRALDAARQRLDDLQRTGATPLAVWYEQDNVRVYEELLDIARRGQRRALTFEMQAMALGRDLCLLGLSHEPFAEYQLAADRLSPFAHTMVLGYCSRCESYIPCTWDFAAGGYETTAVPAAGAPLRYRHRLTLEPDVEARVKAAMEELLTHLADHAG